MTHTEAWCPQTRGFDESLLLDLRVDHLLDDGRRDLHLGDALRCLGLG
jgi:hypothetical protein